MAIVAPKRWVGVVGFPLIGVGLLWAASEQWATIREITASTFEFPSPWRLLGWTITLIAAGLAFGLAAAYARAELSSTSIGATVVAGVLPLAMAIYSWGWMSFGWSPAILRNQFGVFLLSPDTAVASCLVVGFLAANLLSHRVARSTGLWIVEAND